jgi:hypothetical protein
MRAACMKKYRQSCRNIGRGFVHASAHQLEAQQCLHTHKKNHHRDKHTHRHTDTQGYCFNSKTVLRHCGMVLRQLRLAGFFHVGMVLSLNTVLVCVSIHMIYIECTMYMRKSQRSYVEIHEQARTQTCHRRVQVCIQNTDKHSLQSNTTTLTPRLALLELLQVAENLKHGCQQTDV